MRPFDVYQATRASARSAIVELRRVASALWTSPHGQRMRNLIIRGKQTPYSGALISVGGVTAETALIAILDRALLVPNPGILFLPLVAFVAFYWNLGYGILTAALTLISIAVILIPPVLTLKPFDAAYAVRMVTDSAALIFILALARLAASRRDRAEREASRFAALTSIGLALASELDEEPLLRLIAHTACDLTGASFAAFTLRPVDKQGQPIVPSRGDLFQLAAVVGVAPEQEEMFRRTPLGGEGLLAPIFRHARTVRIGDALAMVSAQPDDMETHDQRYTPSQRRVKTLTRARDAALFYAHGEATSRDLKSVGIPTGHPVVRSFLGAPLLDRLGHVRGGLLLGHHEPDRFTDEDERLLVGLASQAATALENARLFSTSQSRAAELDVIFDSISDGIALIDSEGGIIRENRAARELRMQLDQRPEGATAMLKRLAESVTSQTSREASAFTPEPLLEVTTARNEIREYLVSAAPVRGATSPAHTHTPSDDAPLDNLIGAVIVWRDVTETRQLIAERHAREDADAQRLLLQTIVDELPSGVYLAHGPDARLLLANRAAFNVWGAQWETGQPMAEFLRANNVQILRPDGQAMPDGELATIHSIRTGAPIHHQEEVIRRPDGVHLPVLTNTVTIKSSLMGKALQEGAHLGEDADEEFTAIVVLQDVTPLKEAERLKDEFIAMAAHELKTPMAAVKGYSQMLTRGPGSDLGSPLEDWQVEALDAIDTATARLVELTNDLLDVARLQAGRMELRREPTDLVALARRVSRRMQVTTQRHTIVVTSSSEDGYVVANIDSRRIEQVLGNLLSNAIKYSPDGGEITVTVSKREKGTRALMTVRDSGIGIPKEQQGQLFARFVRADNARDRSIGGTGLGLYLCREILARHGGRIWLESQEDHGSVFSVELPVGETGDSDELDELDAPLDGVNEAPAQPSNTGVLAPMPNPQS